MSNHTGSYLINEVLKLLDKEGLFNNLSQKDLHRIVKEIIDVGYSADCNQGEILEDIGEKFKICYYCLNIGKSFTDGLCEVCNKEINS